MSAFSEITAAKEKERIQSFMTGINDICLGIKMLSPSDYELRFDINGKETWFVFKKLELTNSHTYQDYYNKWFVYYEKK